MTLLRVHDNQQNLASDFFKMLKKTASGKVLDARAKKQIYLSGQEMGFCNDDIRVLMEDYFSGK